MNDKNPQSFAEVLGDADEGQIDRIISTAFAELIEHLTDKANFHKDVWKGEISLHAKIAVEPNGKVELTFDRPKVKRQEEKMPKARLYHDPDTGHVTNGPQIIMKGTLDARPIKSAAAPRSAE